MIKVVNQNTVLFSLEDDEPLVFTVQQLRDMQTQKVKDLIMYYAEKEEEIKLIYNIKGGLFITK